MISTRCFLHGDVLVRKKVLDDLTKILDTSVKTKNFIKSRPFNSRLFQILCKEVGAEHQSLLFHTEVCWLSCEKVLRRIYKLGKKVVKFISAIKSKISPWIDDEMWWWVTLTYLFDIFGHLNKLNTNMQGRNETLLTTTDKLYGFLLS